VADDQPRPPSDADAEFYRIRQRLMDAMRRNERCIVVYKRADGRYEVLPGAAGDTSSDQRARMADRIR
jgi:hypothetical protein